ncbi:MAG: hypothetical protein ACR2JJ_10720 [Sphingomicrobium sp.]
MTKSRIAFLLAATGTAAAATAQSSPPPPPPPACTSPEHRQFDFWVGDWDVYRTGTDTLAGRNRIENIYGGCTIRENWMSVRGSGGGSLNMYDPVDKRWHQTWQDGSNARVEFDGGLSDGKMILMGYWHGVGGPGKDALVRMVYTPNADGTVRHLGEQSTDHGLTWTPGWDLTYKPRRAAN